jgi:fucose permease
MCAPFVAAFMASSFGDWKLIFLVFGIVSLIAVIWLYFIKIDESKNTEQRATFASSFKLLGNSYIAWMVLGIFLVVGIDVGINFISKDFLTEKFASAAEFAEKGRSVYFFGKMLGTFAGALMLTMLSSRKFLFWSSVLGLISILALLFVPSEMSALVVIFIIGLGCANIFPLIFSLAVEKYPTRSNEISGLMIMAVSGGALIPFIMGFLKENISLTSSMFVLVICAVYLLFLAMFNMKEKKTSSN